MTKQLNVLQTVRRFHSDDRGIEALQVVMILAVAAIALIAVKTAWEESNGGGIKGWFNDLLDIVLGWVS